MKSIKFFFLLCGAIFSLTNQANPIHSNQKNTPSLNLEENINKIGRPGVGSRAAVFSSGAPSGRGTKISNATARASHGAGYHTKPGSRGSQTHRDGSNFDRRGNRGNFGQGSFNRHDGGGRYGNVRSYDRNFWGGRYSWWMPQFVWPVNVTTYYGFFDNVIPVVQGLNVDPSVISGLIAEIQNLRAQIQAQAAQGVDDAMREQMANLITKLREYKPDLNLQGLFEGSGGGGMPSGGGGGMPAGGGMPSGGGGGMPAGGGMPSGMPSGGMGGMSDGGGMPGGMGDQGQ